MAKSEDPDLSVCSGLTVRILRANRVSVSSLELYWINRALHHFVQLRKILLIIWAASSEKEPSNMHKMSKRKYYPGLCSPFIHSVASTEYVNGQ